jgi:hypothetical protein
MNTEELIEKLATDLKPIPAGALYRRVLRAAALGAAITFALVAFGYGLREDLAAAVGRVDFWMKLGFTIAVATLGLTAVVRVSRPDAQMAASVLWLLAPFALIAGWAFIELAPLAPAERHATWLGQTAMSCPWSILALSIPVLIPLMLSMRRLAPTRPAVAGLLAGLASGGLAAAMYSLHCPEWAASFVATWYVLGVSASGALGAVTGIRVLRW